MLNISPYRAVQANVNSYLFTDSKSAVLVDCLRNSEEAKKLADFVNGKGKTLTHIVITHGHPDHYIGVNTLMSEFPSAKVAVTKQEIKNDIIAFSNWMESVGWLDAEPAMKPKTSSNPDGFDYEVNIGVLATRELTLADGAVLKLNSEYSGAECDHLTTTFSKDLNAFFTGDFCYNGIHLWLAIDKENIANWKSQLDKFSSEFTDPSLRVFPGHGPETTIELFGQVKKYIEDFEGVISKATSREDAMSKMQQLYPDHKESDFLLKNSVDFHIKG